VGPTSGSSSSFQQGHLAGGALQRNQCAGAGRASTGPDRSPLLIPTTGARPCGQPSPRSSRRPVGARLGGTCIVGAPGMSRHDRPYFHRGCCLQVRTYVLWLPNANEGGCQQWRGWRVPDDAGRRQTRGRATMLDGGDQQR
jgi:hypothetical protein